MRTKIVLLVGCVAMLLVLLINSVGAVFSADDELRTAVEQAIVRYLGAPPPNGIVISNITVFDNWAFGTIGIRASAQTGATPDGFLFLAQRVHTEWQVFIEHTLEFESKIQVAPDQVVTPEIKRFFLFRMPTGDGSAQLSLPWATGETWTLTGGPHSNDGTGRPWSSIDFAGGSGQVRAARDGIVYLDCPNFIRINHSDGWQTGYYHISNIAVSNGQSVSRGQYLGVQSSAVGCGGRATGDHQHFSLRLNGAKQEINNRDIGGWTVQEGSAEYQGCMRRISDGATRCASQGQIYNDGTIGSGGTPPPSCNYNADQIVLYEHSNYGGTCKVLGIGEYSNPGAMGFPNDAASSIRVGSNVKATLCRDDNYAGGCEEFTGDDSNLDGNSIGDNQVSSVKVQSRGSSCGYNADQIVLYEHPGYSGTCKTLGIGEYPNPGAMGFPNDAVSAVRVGSNVQAQLCSDDNFSGTCEVFTGDDSDFGNNSIGHDRASSVKVQSRASPPGAPTPTSPGNGAMFNEGDSIALAWSATGDQYYGEIWGGPGGTLTFGWQSETTKNIGAQWAGYVYSWHVKARNSAGESGWSNTPTFTVKPRAPTNLGVQSPSCSQVNLTWTDNSGNEEGYKIYRNGQYLNQVGAGNQSFQDSSVSGGTAYAYYVKAYRGSIESDASDTKNITTPACPPQKPDLRPHTLSGYTYPIVPTSIQGTHTPNTLYSNARTFFDWHFINSGNATATNAFTVQLWVDGTRLVNYTYSNFGSGATGGFDDWAETIATPGTHTVKLIVDPDNVVDESDESNNVWEGQFTWVAINGWKGEYWKNTALDSNPWLTRDDAAINFDWLLNAPDPALPVDGFSARWTRIYNLAAGTYRFSIFHDDGARLFIDGNKVFENWCNDCRLTELVDVPLSAGNHTLVMEMWENSGWAGARLTWENLSACYSLDHSSSPLGAGSVNRNPAANCTSGAGYQRGTTVTLTATSTPGYQFKNWTGCDSTSGNICTVSMLSNKSIGANFERIIASPPPNDEINNSIVIANLPYNYTMDPTGATLASDDPNMCRGTIEGPGSGSVWFRYTPAKSGKLYMNTLGSNYDTMLAVFTGSRGNLTRLACNDDTTTNRQSSLSVNVTANTTYYIEVADWVVVTSALAKPSTSPLAISENKTLLLSVAAGGTIYLPFIKR